MSHPMQRCMARRLTGATSGCDGPTECVTGGAGDWMENEDVATPPDYEFTIQEPRSVNTGIGEDSEEFV